MRRTLRTGFVMLMLVSLAACGKAPQETEATVSAKTEQGAETEKAEPDASNTENTEEATEPYSIDYEAVSYEKGILSFPLVFAEELPKEMQLADAVLEGHTLKEAELLDSRTLLLRVETEETDVKKALAALDYTIFSTAVGEAEKTEDGETAEEPAFTLLLNTLPHLNAMIDYVEDNGEQYNITMILAGQRYTEALSKEAFRFGGDFSEAENVLLSADENGFTEIRFDMPKKEPEDGVLCLEGNLAAVPGTFSYPWGEAFEEKIEETVSYYDDLNAGKGSRYEKKPKKTDKTIIRIYHSGAYIAQCDISWDETSSSGAKHRKRWEKSDRNLVADNEPYIVVLDSSASNISIKVQGKTGLLWEQTNVSLNAGGIPNYDEIDIYLSGYNLEQKAKMEYR